MHPTLHPLERGFDEFFGFLSGGHNYFPEQLTLQDLSEVRQMWGWYRTKLLRNHERVEIDQYLTDELSDAAVEFVQHNAERPFFLYLAYNAPHGPLQATDAYLSRVASIKSQRRRTYAAMVTALDDGVGRVLDALEEKRIAENTLVVFLSDNGGPTANASHNDPLRGHKGSLFEGGIRVPFAACWPGVLPEGVDYDPPVISLDLFATMAPLAGVEASLPHPLDGVNLLPYLRGEKQGRPHDKLFWRMHAKKAFAVRSGDQKIILGEGEPAVRLTNLAEDIGEANNLAADRPEEVTSLRSEIDDWAAQLKGPAFPGLGSWKPPARPASSETKTKAEATR